MSGECVSSIGYTVNVLIFHSSTHPDVIEFDDLFCDTETLGLSIYFIIYEYLIDRLIDNYSYKVR